MTSNGSGTKPSQAAANGDHASTKHDNNQHNVNKSNARDDWEWQKKYHGADNKALDSLMPMIGAFVDFYNAQVLIRIRVGIRQREIPFH